MQYVWIDITYQACFDVAKRLGFGRGVLFCSTPKPTKTATASHTQPPTLNQNMRGTLPQGKRLRASGAAPSAPAPRPGKRTEPERPRPRPMPCALRLPAPWVRGPVSHAVPTVLSHCARRWRAPRGVASAHPRWASAGERSSLSRSHPSNFLLDRPADAGLIIPASWNPSTPCRAHTVAPLMTEPILAGNAIA